MELPFLTKTLVSEKGQFLKDFESKLNLNIPPVYTSYGMIFASLFISNLLSYYTGTDERRIIQVLASHNNDQRQEISNMYKQMYGRVCEHMAYMDLKSDRFCKFYLLVEQLR